MATLTIRNLDERTKKGLRVRAAQHGVSMEEEVRSILRKAIVADSAITAEAKPKEHFFERMHRRFQELGGVDLDIPPREPAPPAIDFSGPAFDPAPKRKRRRAAR